MRHGHQHDCISRSRLNGGRRRGRRMPERAENAADGGGERSASGRLNGTARTAHCSTRPKTSLVNHGDQVCWLVYIAGRGLGSGEDTCRDHPRPTPHGPVIGTENRRRREHSRWEIHGPLGRSRSRKMTTFKAVLEQLAVSDVRDVGNRVPEQGRDNTWMVINLASRALWVPITKTIPAHYRSVWFKIGGV